MCHPSWDSALYSSYHAKACEQRIKPRKTWASPSHPTIKCCRGFKGRYTPTFSVGFGIWALKFYRGIGYRKTPMEYHPVSHTKRGNWWLFPYVQTHSYHIQLVIPWFISPLISYLVGGRPTPLKLDDGWPESEKKCFSSSSEYGSRKK